MVSTAAPAVGAHSVAGVSASAAFTKRRRLRRGGGG